MFNQKITTMFSKSRTLSTLATFVVMYFLPWIFYTVAADFFKDQVIVDASRGQENMILWALTLGCLFMSYFFCTIYERWSHSDYRGSLGIRFGVLLALFWNLGMGFIFYATELRMEPLGYLVDGIFWVFNYGLAGFVASLVYKATTANSPNP